MSQYKNNHKDWTIGWQHEKDAPYDQEWLKERAELFALNGNGWWWGWTPENCPIEELKPYFKYLYDLRETERKKEANDRCDS